MLPPRSVLLFFMCSSAARCWCSSACPLCCWLPVTRAHVKPLRVIDCRPAALVVARAGLSDRRSCSHDRSPHLTARLPVAHCIGMLQCSRMHLRARLQLARYQLEHCVCICLCVGLFVVSIQRHGPRVAGLSLAKQVGKTRRRCGTIDVYSSTIATLSRVCGLRADGKMVCRHGIVAAG